MSRQAMRNNPFSFNCIYSYDFIKRTILVAICKRKKKIDPYWSDFLTKAPFP